MKTIWMAALAALTLTACEEQPRQSELWGPLPPPQGAEQPPAAVDTAFMQGEWTLATMGTYPPETPTTVNITEGRIEAATSCKRYAWTYELTEQRFDAAEAVGNEASCERKDTLWEQAFEETISRANSAQMQMDGSLVIKGAGGEMELTR